MNSEFLQKVKNYFTTEFKQQIGLSLDEETSGIDRALNALLPLGMAAIIDRSRRNENSLKAMYNVANSAAAYVPAAPDVAKLHNEEAGTAIAGDLLGDHEKAVRLSVAKYAGIKNESAGALLMAGMPVLVGSLGIYAKEHNLTSSQFGAFLSDQKDQVTKDIPDEIRDVSSLFGFSNATVDERHIRDAVKTHVAQPRNTGWVIPIILAIIAVLLLVYFSRGCGNHENKLEQENTEIEVPPAAIIVVGVIR